MRSLLTIQVWKVIGFNLLFVMVFLSLFEATIHFFMNSPALIPAGILLKVMRKIYWFERDKDLIQFSQDCAQHDDLLGYTLRPGTCTFSGPEFSNKFFVNRLGLRDDERSVNAPEIIVIGDSHAMGWGVDQEETFAQIIEARTGLTVLNAAVSSYGTAREVASLQRLNTNHLRVLVIQYCDNDLDENMAYYKSKNHLETMSLQQYTEISQAQESIKRYIFGKHLKHILRMYNTLVRSKIVKAVSSLSHRPGLPSHDDPASSSINSAPQLNVAELFLHVLRHSSVDLSGIEIIVMDISTYGRSGHQFINMLQASLSSEERISSSLPIKTIDLASLLAPQHYYRLDGHLNAKGHQVVAEAILQRMDRLISITGTHAH